MNKREIANAWKNIVNIYDESKTCSPKVTMQKIISKYGLSQTEEVFATIAAIKKHDGRIYGENRKYMDRIVTCSENTKICSDNPILYAGLDDIHTAHIDQLITELRIYMSKENK